MKSPFFVGLFSFSFSFSFSSTSFYSTFFLLPLYLPFKYKSRKSRIDILFFTGLAHCTASHYTEQWTNVNIIALQCTSLYCMSLHCTLPCTALHSTNVYSTSLHKSDCTEHNCGQTTAQLRGLATHWLFYCGLVQDWLLTGLNYYWGMDNKHNIYTKSILDGEAGIKYNTIITRPGDLVVPDPYGWKSLTVWAWRRRKAVGGIGLLWAATHQLL